MRRKVAALAVLAILALAVPGIAQAAPAAPEVVVRGPIDPGGHREVEPQPYDPEPIELPFEPPIATEVLFACDTLTRKVASEAPQTENGVLLGNARCDGVISTPEVGQVTPDQLRVDVDQVTPPPRPGEASTGTRPVPATGGPSISASASTPTSDETTWPPEARLVALTLAVAGLLVPLGLRARSGEENEVRRRIYDLVCDDPAISASTVADALDIHLTTAIYHLDQLRDADRIEGIEEGRSTLYFENHRKYGRMEKRVLSTLKKETASDLLELVSENPGIHPAELARQLDLSRTSIKWHTDRLADAGLIDKHPTGGTLELEVPDQAETLLRRYRSV